MSLAARDQLSPSLDLDEAVGFLVEDRRGRIIGRVEAAMYGASRHTPDALAVRFSIFRWRRLLVRVEDIAAIDFDTRIIGLRIDRDALAAFL